MRKYSNQYNDPKTVTYEGKTLTHKEWAVLKGLSVQTVRTRLRLGIPLEQVFSRELKKPFSKNDLEMEMNDSKIESFPPHIVKLINNHMKSVKGRPPTKYGHLIREKYRPIFDKLFAEVSASRNADEAHQGGSSDVQAAPEGSHHVVSNPTLGPYHCPYPDNR